MAITPVSPASEPQQERSLATRQKLLDAAVDILIEEGYAQLSATRVASRAGVTRGAQQHHFPHKATLVSEALRHLAERVLAESTESIKKVPKGKARVRRVLDVLLEHFNGQLFAAMLEISLAARHHPELHDALQDATETAVGPGLFAMLRETLGDEIVDQPDFSQRLAMAYSVTRGLGVLHLLGYTQDQVTQQWKFMRTQLENILGGGDAVAPPQPAARKGRRAKKS